MMHLMRRESLRLTTLIDVNPFKGEHSLDRRVQGKRVSSDLYHY